MKDSLVPLTSEDIASIKSRAVDMLKDPYMFLPLQQIVFVCRNAALHSDADPAIANRLVVAEEIIKEVAKGLRVPLTYPEPDEETLLEWAERLINQIMAFPTYPLKNKK